MQQTYGISITTGLAFPDAVVATSGALAAQDFHVLTEVDVASILGERLAVGVPPQVILGACHSELAHRALEIEPSIGLLMPCNVVVRHLDPGGSVIEAIDPLLQIGISGNEELQAVAWEVAGRAELSRPS